VPVSFAPVTVWTPDGEYETPGHISLPRDFTGIDLVEAMWEAKERRMHVPTSGEWSRMLDSMHGEEGCGDMFRSMTTGHGYDATSTILVYRGTARGTGWTEGLVIQDPQVGRNGGGCAYLELDADGVPMGRRVWQMPLPKPGFFRPIRNMPRECDAFIDTIFGKPGARKSVPIDAYMHCAVEARSPVRVVDRFDDLDFNGRGPSHGRYNIGAVSPPSFKYFPQKCRAVSGGNGSYS